ncbi:MAG TPA: mycofactocin radical SAM maturase [Acidimicrobiales bacterium]|nr:mycofactocin radical SAM maturase [Acidimicrobiales bacterium]
MAITAAPAGLDPSRPYRLHPQVAVRPEEFGALAYHYGNRRLVFLRSPALVELVRRLGDHPSVEAALATVNASRRPAFAAALASLERAELIQDAGPAAARSRPPKDASDGAPPLGSPPASPTGATSRPLVAQLRPGLESPICLTWELTYACNLACVHCLSSSGRRDPAELDTAEARAVIDEMAAMSIFYVNVGGGEPTIRPDFFDLVDYAVDRGVGVKFSTNGTRIDAARAAALAAKDYVDVQVSLDGATAAVNDAVRGEGSYAAARRAMDHLAAAGFGPFKISVVVTRHNLGQLDDFDEIARSYGAQLRLTRLRPSGRGADTWDQLHPTAEQQHQLYRWLLDRPHVLTGDSFFHLSALGESLPGLNLCGAGRVVCLIDPVGDVYACPFVLHPDFRAGNVRQPGGFASVWRQSSLFADLRRSQSGGACSACGAFDACQGGCMAAKFFTGLPLDGPDPECALGHGEPALSRAGVRPATGPGHSRPSPVAVPLRLRRGARS